jgi:hypothetical protein
MTPRTREHTEWTMYEIGASLFKPGLGSPLSLIIPHTLSCPCSPRWWPSTLVVQGAEQKSTFWMIAHLLSRSSVNRWCAIIRMLFCSALEVSNFFGGYFASMCLELDFLHQLLHASSITMGHLFLLCEHWRRGDDWVTLSSFIALVVDFNRCSSVVTTEKSTAKERVDSSTATASSACSFMHRMTNCQHVERSWWLERGE